MKNEDINRHNAYNNSLAFANKLRKERLLIFSLITLFLLISVLFNNTVSSQPILEKATFAGGCFWCMEAALEKVEGVIEVISGYTGGEAPNPTYEEVSTGKTGHYEAVEVLFDPTVVSYADLLDVFWRNIDPTDDGGQFYDRGSQYRTAIFYHNDEQKKIAEQYLPFHLSNGHLLLLFRLSVPGNFVVAKLSATDLYFLFHFLPE